MILCSVSGGLTAFIVVFRNGRQIIRKNGKQSNRPTTHTKNNTQFAIAFIETPSYCTSYHFHGRPQARGCGDSIHMISSRDFHEHIMV